MMSGGQPMNYNQNRGPQGQNQGQNSNMSYRPKQYNPPMGQMPPSQNQMGQMPPPMQPMPSMSMTQGAPSFTPGGNVNAAPFKPNAGSSFTPNFQPPQQFNQAPPTWNLNRPTSQQPDFMKFQA